MPNNSILFIGKCGHVIPAGPTQAGLEHYCPVCERTTFLEDVHRHEWHVSCRVNNCKFGRWCGLSKIWAANLANKHYQSKRDHVANVAYVINPAAQRVWERMRNHGLVKR